MNRFKILVARFLQLCFEPGFPRRLLLAELGIGALVLWRGIELAKDSKGYLDGASYREPLYPLLLDTLELVLGGHALTGALVVQLLLGLIAVGTIIMYLKRGWGLPEWLAWVGVGLLLVLPYLVAPAVASRVLSLGIAYPLFLLVMRNLLAAFAEERLDRFAAAAAWAAALILSRLQFLFLVPVLALASLLWLSDRASRKRAVAALTVVAAIAAGTGLAERAYRLVRHGRFAGAPFVGIQLVAGGLYVAPSSLADELPAETRDLFLALHDAAMQRNLLAAANPSPGGISSYAWHYRQNYNEIVWHVVMPELRRRAGGAASDDDWFAVEDQLLPLALSLIRAEPIGFARLYLSNFLSGLGYSYTILLVIIAPTLLIRGLFKRNGVELAIGLVVVTHLANCALVALVEPLKLRYSFYASGLVLLLLIARVLGAARAPLTTGSPRSGPPGTTP